MVRSFNHIATGELGIVEIESQWTATHRERDIVEAHASKARDEAPASAGRFEQEFGREPPPSQKQLNRRPGENLPAFYFAPFVLI